jgi:hypothetical protein
MDKVINKPKASKWSVRPKESILAALHVLIVIVSLVVHPPFGVNHRQEQWKIAQLRRTPLLSDTSFMDRVSANELEEGKKSEGQVLDVSTAQAFVDIRGLTGRLNRDPPSGV